MSNISDGNNNEPPPVAPTVVPSVVDTLDPDLAAAYRSGNPTIVSAVNSGMTTNAMIVNEVIRMGGSMAGLPPAVQVMVTERKKAMDEEAELENQRLKKMLAGVAAMGMMATNIAQGGEYYGDGGNRQQSFYSVTNPPDSAAMASMTAAQKQDYFTSLAGTGYSQYSELSEPVRQQHITNVGDEGRNKENEGRHSIDELPNVIESDKAMGDTPEKRQEATKRILAAADYNNNGPQFHEALKGLTPAQREYALQYRELLYKANFGSDANKKANTAQGAKQEGDIKTEHANVTDGADDLAQIQIKIERDREYVRQLNAQTAALKNAATPEARQKALDGADQAMAGISAPAAGEETLVRAGRDENLAARKAIDEGIAKAEVAAAKPNSVAAQSAMGGMDDDEPAGARVATIDASKLGAKGASNLAELGAAPAQQIAANDAPEGPQRKVAASGPAMGGAG